MRTAVYTLLCLSIFYISMPQKIQAQDYHPMAVENAHWIVNENDVMGFVIGMWEYHCLGDTVIDNIAYKKIFRRELQPTMDPPPFNPITYYGLFGFLRDDVASRKVYARLPESNYFYFECGLDQDVLLYDFSLQVNDSVNFCAMTVINDITLTSITPGAAFGVNTNIYTVSFNEYRYYEGVGSDFGLFEEMLMPLKNTDELEYTQLAYYCPNDTCAFVVKSGGFMIEPDLVIYPNPASHTITFTLEKTFTGNTGYNIINSAGQTCLTGAVVRGTNNINIDNLTSGLYLLKISTGGRLFTSKFVKR
ncbi:MAG TPA: T9SS type A sorting domain-containing protein [Lentimicrobium sp.]|nr:T9SS type A sorting domain-containing protein [Lentimicrobium sp.]